MTWGAFIAAMRRGVSERTAAATRRGGMQQQQRAINTNKGTAATQMPKQPPKKTPPMETWDFIMLDVRLIPSAACHCLWFLYAHIVPFPFSQPYGEPVLLPPF